MSIPILTRLHTSPRLLPALFALALTMLAACGAQETQEGKHTIQFWHFWSEPAQKDALKERIAAFEAANPSLQVALTDLYWAEGKAKLMMAFNAGTPPDIIQLGFEWTPEFARAEALLPLPDSLVQARGFTPAAAQGAVRYKGRQYAQPWTMNTRAMLLSDRALAGHDAPQSWDNLRAILRATHQPAAGIYGFGVNTSEPHNVLKKALPFMWSAGSAIFSSTPLAASFDEEAIVGLEFYRELSGLGIQENSRALDQLFLQDKIAVWISGAWVIDMAMDYEPPTFFTVLPHIPTRTQQDTGWSILGGDCLAVPNAAPNPQAAFRLIAFLTEYEQSSAFCRSVSDAGLPADTRALADESLLPNPQARGFAAQMRYARALPWSPVFLSAESELERAIMAVIYGQATPFEALDKARENIARLEAAAE